MPDSKSQEILRIILGALRPEIRKFAREFVNIFPKEIRTEVFGRLVGAIAQIIEKRNIFGFQESISDAIEMISDEIIKQTSDQKEKEKVTQLKDQFNKKIGEIEERLKSASNIQEEKERILEELEAFKEIFQAMKEIEQKFAPPEKKKERIINWNKIFEKIKTTYETIKNTTTEKIIPALKEAYRKIDEKANTAAQKVKKWPRPF